MDNEYIVTQSIYTSDKCRGH